MQTVCIIGLGYIGLPTASLLATKGFNVHGVDVNEKVVTALNNGEILIHEPSLDVLVRTAVGSGRLKASTIPCEADIFIIAVPTPFKADKEPDLSFVQAATTMLAPYLKSGDLIILESTSPVGTTEQVYAWIKNLRADLFEKNMPPIYAAYCPERVLPGRILQELVENDRIAGGIDEASTQAAVSFYKSFVHGDVLPTNSRTAEMVKLTENAFRDVNIAFANELSLLCNDFSINVWETIRLANRHPRVNILQPGPGVGGHCIAVDPWFIVSGSPLNSRLIRTAREVNDQKPEWVLEQIISKASRYTKPCVACLGLAFKADIDDLRESPALHIVEKLALKLPDAEILAVEPYIKALPASLSSSQVKLTELYKAVEMADIICILTDHRQFKELPLELLSRKDLIDTKGLFNL